ncbi:hypothetical protein EVAR_19535_1 [Eumeta japonica]|uniref:Uncharacterized protein n=1 Tax=Eumeta variegata TaxID=151549 RepID=A0A4C1UF61_EUMVA|nr:hypothetical protein EVAR_19535_1 [Eumeta japonica]
MGKRAGQAGERRRAGRQITSTPDGIKTQKNKLHLRLDLTNKIYRGCASERPFGNLGPRCHEVRRAADAAPRRAGGGRRAADANIESYFIRASDADCRRDLQAKPATVILSVLADCKRERGRRVLAPRERTLILFSPRGSSTVHGCVTRRLDTLGARGVTHDRQLLLRFFFLEVCIKITSESLEQRTNREDIERMCTPTRSADASYRRRIGLGCSAERLSLYPYSAADRHATCNTQTKKFKTITERVVIIQRALKASAPSCDSAGSPGTFRESAGNDLHVITAAGRGPSLRPPAPTRLKRRVTDSNRVSCDWNAMRRARGGGRRAAAGRLRISELGLPSVLLDDCRLRIR